ncbi:MAG: hypothetical protein JSV88_15620 [Candidatus Aminicenantes bacterium]|nr:MAG: hypothetical protein JSV88_15620 [Candidatus Aminicenantes bacterium]
MCLVLTKVYYIATFCRFSQPFSISYIRIEIKFLGENAVVKSEKSREDYQWHRF